MEILKCLKGVQQLLAEQAACFCRALSPAGAVAWPVLQPSRGAARKPSSCVSPQQQLQQAAGRPDLAAIQVCEEARQPDKLLLPGATAAIGQAAQQVAAQASAGNNSDGGTSMGIQQAEAPQASDGAACAAAKAMSPSVAAADLLTQPADVTAAPVAGLAVAEAGPAAALPAGLFEDSTVAGAAAAGAGCSVAAEGHDKRAAQPLTAAADPVEGSGCKELAMGSDDQPAGHWQCDRLSPPPPPPTVRLSDIPSPPSVLRIGGDHLGRSAGENVGNASLQQELQQQ